MSVAQVHVGDIGHPDLIELRGNDVLIQVGVAFIGMMAVGDDDEPPFDPAQQTGQFHQPVDTLTVDGKTVSLQLRRHAPDTISGEHSGQSFELLQQK